MVLLVMDTQKLITNNKLYQFELFVSNIKKLIKVARENDCEVIYVRHDDGEVCELTKGNEGYEIYEEFRPNKDQKIFDKNINSAFKETGLLEYLKNKEEDEVIIVGLQTDYCMDANVKCAFEHGFHVIVPSNCHSTVDNIYMSKEKTYHYYYDFMWNNRYAECLSVDETIKRIKII